MNLELEFTRRIAAIHGLDQSSVDAQVPQEATSVDIRHAEFKAMAEVFLGAGFDSAKLNQVEDQQLALHKHLAELARRHEEHHDLSDEDYVSLTNASIVTTFRNCEIILGSDAFHKLFGTDPNEVNSLIDRAAFLNKNASEASTTNPVNTRIPSKGVPKIGRYAVPGSVNINELRGLYNENAIARAFLDHAAQRERDRAETSVDRAQAILRENGSDPSRADVVYVFQRLEELGCGKFIVGRHGRPSRIAWSARITDVGRAAAGEQQGVPELEETVAGAIEVTAEILTHTFNLRPDTQVTLELPVDLTSHEAARLATFVKSLPMED